MDPKDLGKRELSPEELKDPALDIDPSLKDLPPELEDDPSSKKKGDEGADKKVYSDTEKHLYTRATSAEEKVKLYKEKFGDIDGAKPIRTDVPKDSTDPFTLAKVVASLKDYDTEEIDFASTIASVKKIAPAEAVKTPDFQLWLKGKRDRDDKDNKIPAPGGAGIHDFAPSSDDIAKMSNAQHAQAEKDFNAKKRNKGSGL